MTAIAYEIRRDILQDRLGLVEALAYGRVAEARSLARMIARRRVCLKIVERGYVQRVS